MSPKISKSFHQHLSVKSNTWADCQVKLTQKKKIVSSFGEWIAFVKTEGKALPTLVKYRLWLGSLLKGDARIIWSFLSIIRSVGITESESKRN